jgi:hypothetical protein
MSFLALMSTVDTARFVTVRGIYLIVHEMKSSYGTCTYYNVHNVLNVHNLMVFIFRMNLAHQHDQGKRMDEFSLALSGYCAKDYIVCQVNLWIPGWQHGVEACSMKT